MHFCSTSPFRGAANVQYRFFTDGMDDFWSITSLSFSPAKGKKHLIRLPLEGMETTEYRITGSLNSPDNMKNDISRPMWQIRKVYTLYKKYETNADLCLLRNIRIHPCCIFNQKRLTYTFDKRSEQESDNCQIVYLTCDRICFSCPTDWEAGKKPVNQH